MHLPRWTRTGRERAGAPRTRNLQRLLARRETIEHGIEPRFPRLAQPADATGETGRGEAAEAPTWREALGELS